MKRRVPIGNVYSSAIMVGDIVSIMPGDSVYTGTGNIVLFNTTDHTIATVDFQIRHTDGRSASAYVPKRKNLRI